MSSLIETIDPRRFKLARNLGHAYGLRGVGTKCHPLKNDLAQPLTLCLAIRFITIGKFALVPLVE